MDESSNLELMFTWQRENAPAPQVSVVVPVFNYRHFLLDALESVAWQTLVDLDLIIVDDASTDDSAIVASQWLLEHATRFRKAQLLRHRRNSGLAQSRNDGFNQAESELIFPLDADNMVYPSCLEKLERSLRHSPAAFAYCLIERFMEPVEHLPPPSIMNLHHWDSNSLGFNNTIDAMVLMRKRFWNLLGGYNITMPKPGWEDYDFWFRLARANGYGLQVYEILARYRVHPHSMLHTVTNRQESQIELKRYLREAYPEFFIESFG